MKLTVVTSDLTVIKDNEAYIVADLSHLDKNIHAIQWQDTTGEIEYIDNTPNLFINDITPFNQCITDWETAKAKYIADNTPTEAESEAAFKSYRNSLLSESDWTQLPDNKLSDTKKTEWQTYRQSLRDMPTTKTATYQELLDNISHSDYPTKPS